MTDPTAHASVLLALQAEVDELRELLDAKSHEAGLYARRMEQAQRSRDKGKALERAAVVAWLRALTVEWSPGTVAYAIERGEHRREE